MKRWGFLTGATLAAIGVWIFYALTTVTDDDRLTEALRDHCLPYVTDGTAPFTDLGRAPGVYDNLDLRDSTTDGGARLIYDNRFTAQWGIVTGAERTSRICEVRPIHGQGASPFFAVDSTGFVARYTDVLGLVPEDDSLTTGPRTFGWYDTPGTLDRGLRVVMVAAPGQVSSVVVLNDLPD